MSSRFDRVLTGVLGIVHNKAGDVVVVKQKTGPYANSWLFPGGALEVGETPRQAVSREVYEETGILSENIERLLGTYQLQGMFQGKPYQLVMFVYVLQSEQLIDKDFEFDNVDGAQWVTPSDFPLHSTDKRFLTDAELCIFDEKTIVSELQRDSIDMRLIV